MTCTSELVLERGTRVRATQGVREISAGDEGEVIAAWIRAKPLVRWDKDGVPRTVHRKRLELI